MLNIDRIITKYLNEVTSNTWDFKDGLPPALRVKPGLYWYNHEGEVTLEDKFHEYKDGRKPIKLTTKLPTGTYTLDNEFGKRKNEKALKDPNETIGYITPRNLNMYISRDVLMQALKKGLIQVVT